MGQLRDLAARTPPGRERHVDLLRAVAILAVVVGHWFVVVIEERDGVLAGYSALVEITWAHPLTWLFQVMPLFFVVGGYANAASLRAAHRRGEGSTGWLLTRSARLAPPVSVLIAVVVTAAAVALLLGGDPRQIGASVAAAVLPLWFLVAYFAMILLTPAMHAAHRRWGLAVPVVLVVLVALGDLARLGPIPDVLGYGNFLLGWLVIHQVGFAWHDGRLPARPAVGLPLLLGGLAALVALTTLGPYATSMVNIPGDSMDNASPPTLALLALGTAQLGLALLLRDVSERRLQRLRPWTAVVAVNSVVFTLFLWHMPAVVVTALLLDSANALPTPPVDSPEWWAWRGPWVALLAVALAVLVAVFGRVEQRAGRAPRRPADRSEPRTTSRGRTVLTAAGYLTALFGLLSVSWAGPGVHGPLGLSTTGVLAWAAGATTLWWLRGRAPSVAAEPEPANEEGPS